MLVDGPHGSFRPGAAGEPYVLIAAGIGITPVMSMLRTFDDDDDPRALTLVYGSRGWDDITFREELEQLGGRLSLEVVHVLSDPPTGWAGERGRIERALLERALTPDTRTRSHFVCGPPTMVDAVQIALDELGIGPELVHVERFAAA